MAESLNESINTLEDLEISQIEKLASQPNVDMITVCKCCGLYQCLRESGRNFCPCKSVNNYCSSVWHDGDSSSCMNTQQIDWSDSEESDESDNSERFSDTESSEQEPPVKLSASENIGLDHTPGRGRGRAVHHKWATGRGRGVGRSGRGIGQSGRGARRGRVAGRGRGTRHGRKQSQGSSSRCPGRLELEVNSEQNREMHEEQLRTLVDGLNIEQLRDLALELLRRQPATFADIINGEIPTGNGGDDPSDPPAENLPEWCKCGHCVQMSTQEENKCCSRSYCPCITTEPLFSQLVLDANVLDLAMCYREDTLALENQRNNQNFRHAAYRQFVLCQHGHLGRGNRRVVPSCCVKVIRSRYPSPNGIYTGYRPSRL